MEFKSSNEVIDSSGFAEAVLLSSQLYDGDGSYLYLLNCCHYDEWTKEDVEGMIEEFKDCLDIQEADEVDNAIEILNELLKFY